MRYVFLDTETTGLDPALGHRIVEIAAVEVCNRRLTDRHFHRYLNPGRESDEGALRVHGLTREFLRDKPVFQDVCSEFLEFIADAEIFIHNAPFDVGFINRELDLIRFESMQNHCLQIIDTLVLAKSCTRARETIWMRYVSVIRSIIPTEHCMALYSMQSCWPKFTWQ